MNGKRTIAIALLALLVTAPAWGEPSKRREVAPAGKAYTWYDNGKARTAFIDTDLVAEIDVEPNPARASRVRILDATSLRAQESRQQGRSFAVLRDRPGGSVRALPGGVIVRLDGSMSEAQALSWLAAQGLELQAKLPVGGHAFLVRGEPGLASLELANRLNALPDASAQPEWWQEREAR